MTTIRVRAAMIPLEQLLPQPRRNVRTDLGDDAELEEMAASMRVHGVLQPLLVAPFGTAYRIIAGHRRHRAATIAGLHQVPCMIREGQPASGDRWLMLVENLHRRALDPVDTAHAIGELCREHSVVDVARMLGMSQTTVAARRRLLDLPAPVQDRVRSRAMTLGQADTLARQVRTTGHGEVTTSPKPPPHFTRSHPLAADAADLCSHPARHRYGAIACGPCWERAIRDDALTPTAGLNDDLDELAIDLAIAGHRVPLPPAERDEAIARLTARGASAARIADLLGCTSRTVQRVRTATRTAA